MASNVLTLRVYCTCGAAWLMTKTVASVYTKMLREFAKGHKGDGHKLCDARTAAARRREEAAS